MPKRIFHRIVTRADLTRHILANDISPCIIEQYQVCLLRRPCGYALQMSSSNFNSQEWAPRRRYLSSFRKLASSSGVIPSIFPRKSYSTSSDFASEDSTSVATLPDHVNTDYSATGQHPPFDAGIDQMLSIGSSSGKNTGLGRASSFAERIWKRGRKKSSAGASDAPPGTCFILFVL
jgi:hypothetical protein